MQVNVVSDVHANVEALRKAGDGADALICLGDLVLFVDYDDYSAGILPELFGAEAASTYITMRSALRFDEARAYSKTLWDSLDRDRGEVIEEAIRGQYAALFDAMPTPAYVTYGNVDVPRFYDDYVRDGITILDGQTVDIGGRTFGFVGGGLKTAMNTPFEISDEEYAAKVAAVGAVDVLCCHIPPALPLLTYDVLGRRFERGSEALIDAIRDTQPEIVLFGHVHNPLSRRVRIGRSECVNVGHFRGSGEPYVLRW
jgi:Icc-related predicted phosphoesterase